MSRKVMFIVFLSACISAFSLMAIKEPIAKVGDVTTFNILQISKESKKFCEDLNNDSLNKKNRLVHISDTLVLKEIYDKSIKVLNKILEINGGKQFDAPVIFINNNQYFCVFGEAPIKKGKRVTFSTGGIVFAFDIKTRFLTNLEWNPVGQ